MPSSQPIHAQQTCLLPLLARHAACYNSRTVAGSLFQPVLILTWSLTCTQSSAVTTPADPADPALTSKPAHTFFPYYCHCVHAESAVTTASSHVLAPHPAQNVPIFPCLGSSCPTPVHDLRVSCMASTPACMQSLCQAAVSPCIRFLRNRSFKILI